MALYGPAIKKIIPPGANDKRIIPIAQVFHIAVSESQSLYDWFTSANAAGLESHGYIRRTGKTEQYRDTEYEADAQSPGANSWLQGGQWYGLISWETQGMEFGLWTPEQMDTIKDLIIWAKEVHGIPTRVCPGPKESGNGYHSLFTAWNIGSHTCPGRDRKEQFHDVLVPWMNNLSAPAPEPPREIDMFMGRSADGSTWMCNGIVKTRITTSDVVNTLKAVGVPDVSTKSSEFWAEFPTYEGQFDLINGKLNDLINGA